MAAVDEKFFYACEKISEYINVASPLSLVNFGHVGRGGFPLASFELNAFFLWRQRVWGTHPEISEESSDKFVKRKLRFRVHAERFNQWKETL